MAHYTSTAVVDKDILEWGIVVPPLHRAAYYDHAETALYLLQEGANPNQCEDENGQTPLHWAAYMNAHATARILLAYGANLHARSKLGFSPLHAAALADAAEVAALLLESGARVRAQLIGARSKSGESPLQLAALVGGRTMIRLLLENGADIKELATPDQLSDEMLLQKLVGGSGLEPLTSSMSS